MASEKLRQQLIIDEGYRSAVYRDTLGNLTVGIGHLVLPSDNLHYGDHLNYEKIQDLFNHDVVHAEIGCRAVIKNFDEQPEDIRDVLVNMCFNLGAHGLKAFKKFIAAIEARDYSTAAEEMKDSLWFAQVKGRGLRLYKIIKEKGVGV